MTSGWLPTGRQAAVCLSIDDVHPGSSRAHDQLGGDLATGALGRLERLLARHPQLRATVFVTPDWRERSPFPTRHRLARIPLAANHLHLTSPLPRGAMRLDRHPAFVDYVRACPRFEIAVHGLSHLARGHHPVREFDGLGTARARRRLRRARTLFARARMPFEPGFATPGWVPSEGLIRALPREHFRWISSARDLDTPIQLGARTAGSGLQGVSLMTPEWISGGELLHFTINFQRTSADDRAFAILEHGGLLAIKAHAVTDAFGHVPLDGLDQAYCDQLGRLLTRIEDRYGDSVWWTTMGELAANFGHRRARPAVPA